METSSSRAVIAADIGGTHVRFALVTEKGEILLQEKRSRIRGSTPERMIYDWIEIAKGLESRAQGFGLKVSALGFGIAGKIDVEEGRVIFSPNIPELNGFDVVAFLRSHLAYPVAIDNDANVFGRGELWVGKGSKYPDWLGITLGTGVGGCVILDGRVWTGSRGIGFAGEIGHTTVYPNGRLCMCGKRGCLEAYASEGGLLRHIANCGSGKEYGLSALSAKRLYDMALSGNPEACRLFEEFGTALGIAIANAFTLLGIRCAIVGGGVSNAWGVFYEPLLRATVNNCSMLNAEDIVIEKSELEDSAALYGAARLALDII
ncbi:ROK family protein [Thermodesulforhabdus norvegica]|uniref:Glucokinase n=1 Tax=Thermodesulforhabdus norvegica TaxID=39841 RepID=A0A1I4R949_9BACT|nr:ROK family protein [Thermodesulforhabdus norvegica]SFM48739.1 glucokinase [Thermodesulforhabdus norvegica]